MKPLVTTRSRSSVSILYLVSRNVQLEEIDVLSDLAKKSRILGIGVITFFLQ